MQNVKVSLPIIHCSSSCGFAAAISSLQYSTLSVTVKLSNSWCYVILVAIFAFLHKSKIKVVFQSMGAEDLVIFIRNRHWVFEWFKKSESYIGSDWPLATLENTDHDTSDTKIQSKHSLFDHGKNWWCFLELFWVSSAWQQNQSF